MRKRGGGGSGPRHTDGRRAGSLCIALLSARQRPHARFQPGVVWNWAGVDRVHLPGIHSAASLGKRAARRAYRPGNTCGRREQYADRSLIPAACRSVCADEDSVCAGADAAAVRFGQRSGSESSADVVWEDTPAGG